MTEKYHKISDLVIMDSLKNQANFYGIEGLEDAIKRVYSHMPKTRDALLKVYNKMYRNN